MQYGVAVPLEVVDEATTYEGPVVAQGCTQAFTPRLARDDPALPVDSQRRRVKQRQATESTADALAALPVADDERAPRRGPALRRRREDAVVEAPVATARAISRRRPSRRRSVGR